ncbi:MAG: DNA polymerase, partial [Candidatus Coproplasma sp.]
MDKLVLIDGNSLFNRAFYATPIFTTKDGNPTNAIFGFVKLLFKIKTDLNPEYMIVAFDMKAPTFRHKMFDGYKATRKPMPTELAVQVEPLKSLLSAMNIATCQQEGIEADDIIGTLSNRYDVHSYVYTGDRDSYQLVDDKTDVYFTKRGVSELTKLTKDNFLSEVGILPYQVIDLKALMGDKSDNIPGVTGIGEKTALNLLNSYGTLDGIYSHIDEIKGATRDKLVNFKDQAYMSYELATINRNCDIDIMLEDCKVPKKFSSEVKRLFTQFEFKSLLSLNIFEEEIVKATDYNYPELTVCENLSELENLAKNAGQFYIDFNESGAEIYVGERQYSVRISLDLFGGLPFEGFISAIRKIFGNKENRVILFDFKSFLHDYSQYGIVADCDVEDISVMKYLADFFDGNDSLAKLCDYFGYDKKYSAFVLRELYQKYKAILESDGDNELYNEIEKPLIRVLYGMEKEGVKVDISRLNEFAKDYSEKIAEISERVYSLCGCRFNINSPSQLGEVLFEKLGLKSGKKNKNGKYSTSAEILENLADDSEVVHEILKFRQYQKLFSTYIEGIRPLIDNKTGLVHTTYNQTVTSTGRLSSTNPNLQNIPIREE